MMYVFSILLWGQVAIAQESDFVATVAYIPQLIFGLMLAGAIAGGAIVVFVRKTNKRPANKALPQASLNPPPPPTKPEMPGLAPMDLANTGGFDPSDDFEEPTCFAELPKND